jgi:hypothetical protein
MLNLGWLGVFKTPAKSPPLLNAVKPESGGHTAIEETKWGSTAC